MDNELAEPLLGRRNDVRRAPPQRAVVAASPLSRVIAKGTLFGLLAYVAKGNHESVDIVFALALATLFVAIYWVLMNALDSFCTALRRRICCCK